MKPMTSPWNSTLEIIDGLEVWVIRKAVKSMTLRVKPPDGRVELSVPYLISDRALCDFIALKRQWIEQKIEEIRTSPFAQAALASPEEVKAWKAVVSAFVPPLIERWKPVLGVQAKSVAYRNMKSRWGSCQPATGRICINVRLALYPPECLEYVVVHELCHLRVSGHGHDFKALMTQVMPDWEKRRAKLRS